MGAVLVSHPPRIFGLGVGERGVPFRANRRRHNCYWTENSPLNQTKPNPGLGFLDWPMVWYDPCSRPSWQASRDFD